jgi:hypothetical protein
MAVSVRMDPLLEKELALAAQRQGITKSQFIVDAVQRALGRKNSYELMLKLKAEEDRLAPGMRAAFAGTERPYDTEGSRKQLLTKLRKKHGVSSAG